MGIMKLFCFIISVFLFHLIERKNNFTNTTKDGQEVLYKMTRPLLHRRKPKRKIELLLIGAKINDIKTINLKARIKKTQKNSKFSL